MPDERLEAYHQVYEVLVNPSLPADEQAKIMRDAIARGLAKEVSNDPE